MTLEEVKDWLGRRPTLADALGIELTALTADYLEGRMPVDGRTHQPMGLLHGGASVALAETLGSVAASLKVDPTKQACVGLEINANHLRGVREGYVVGRATALHVGRSTQVWEIKIREEATDKLVCISRITMAVIDLPAGPAAGQPHPAAA
ncbi:hotdog fold thioesterase [uncultured Hymenobacter sp.]|uniref:hotdog fold thioesterase n=1 Tax=uncultured Hymenobacter sp. TaxID=170016 RepID=UPI0035CC58B4